MAWDETIVTSDFDAQAASNGRTTERAGQRDIGSTGFSNGNDGTIEDILQFVLGKSDVVGINATKVPDMREQIRTSVSNIQTYLDGIDPTTDASGAFQSEEVQAAVAAYVEKVKEYCKALISDLLAFSDKLQDVYDAWKASTDQFASDSIAPSTASYADTTQYTETK